MTTRIAVLVSTALSCFPTPSDANSTSCPEEGDSRKTSPQTAKQARGCAEFAQHLRTSKFYQLPDEFYQHLIKAYVDKILLLYVNLQVKLNFIKFYQNGFYQNFIKLCQTSSATLLALEPHRAKFARHASSSAVSTMNAFVIFLQASMTACTLVAWLAMYSSRAALNLASP